LRRWLIKPFAGSWAAGNFARVQRGEQRYQPDLELVEIVFGRSVYRTMWPVDGRRQRKESGILSTNDGGGYAYFSSDRLMALVFR